MLDRRRNKYLIQIPVRLIKSGIEYRFYRIRKNYTAYFRPVKRAAVDGLYPARDDERTDKAHAVERITADIGKVAAFRKNDVSPILFETAAFKPFERGWQLQRL